VKPRHRQHIAAFWFVVLLSVVSALPAAAQRYTVTGIVIDARGAVLPGVHVYLEGTSVGTITDREGRFAIALRAGTYTMVCSAVGFAAIRRPVVVEGDVDLRFVLEEAIIGAGEVVVTAARRPQLAREVPSSLEVLPASLLETRNVVELQDALQSVSGLQVQGNQIVIRGTSGFAYNTGSRVLMLVDGMPMLSPETDGLPLDALPPTQIHQIEVLKGPGSALYGSGALGGVVNVITRGAPEERQFAYRTFVGAYQPTIHDEWSERWPPSASWRAFAGAAVSLAGRLNARSAGWASVDYRDDPGFRHFSSTRQLQAFGKLMVDGGGALELDIFGGFLARKRNSYFFWNGIDDALNPGSIQLSGSSTPSGTNDNVTNHVMLLPQIRVSDDRSLLTVRARLFGTMIRPIEDDGTVRSAADGTVGARFGGEAQWQRFFRNNLQLIAGAAIDANATRSSFYRTDEGRQLGKQPELGLYAQAEGRPHPRVPTVLGIRFDWFRISSTESASRLSPKFSLGYDVRPGLSARLSTGLGFRVPSLAERYTDDQGFFPIFRNPFIRPETSASVEAGLRGWFRARRSLSFDWDIAFFAHTLRNMIEPRFVRTEVQGATRLGFQFVNLDGGRVAGAEVTASLGHPAGHALRAGYTHLRSEDRSTGLALPFRPTHLAVVGADLVWRNGELGVDYRFGSRPKVIDTDFARFVPDADILVATRVVDVTIGYRFGALVARVIVRNATNYQYLERPALLAPPRQFIVQVAGAL
jgi:iron complex outermembrane receptor protein